MICAHVPTPFSGATSSLFVVIQALCREARRTGDHSLVVASQNRDVLVHDAIVLPVDYKRHCPREWFSRRENIADAVSGLIGRNRVHQGLLFEPAIEVLRDAQPDVVLLHEGHHATPSIPYWRAQWPNVRLVLYGHIPLSRTYARRELTRFFRDLDGVICVSNSGLNSLAQRVDLSIMPHHCVIHNGVDTHRFSNSGRQSSDTFRIAFVGEVAHHKGPHLLLEAVRLLPSFTDRNVAIRLVGNPRPSRRGTRYLRQLERVASELSYDVEIATRVDHDQLPPVMRWADLVCVPSVWPEPFGMVVLEALACGAVVITSGAGGLHEAGGDVAVQVDPRDRVAFARAIARYANDDELVESTRARGSAYVARNTWERRYGQLRATLQEWFGGFGQMNEAP